MKRKGHARASSTGTIPRTNKHNRSNKGQQTTMNDYEILALMDTHKVMKQQGIDVPDVFTEFLSGVVPMDIEPELVDESMAQADIEASNVNELLEEEDLAEAIASAAGIEEDSPSSMATGYISDEDVDEIEE